MWKCYFCISHIFNYKSHMSKKEKSIELLNKAVNDELLAVHQIYVFSFPV